MKCPGRARQSEHVSKQASAIGLSNDDNDSGPARLRTDLNTKGTVILLTGNTNLEAHRLTDANATFANPGESAFAHLAQAVLSDGYTFTTADRYNRTQSSSPSYLLNDLSIPIPIPTTCQEAQKVLCLSLESPLITHRLHHRLDTVTEPYVNSLFFSGLEKRVSAETTFHPLYWPNPMPIKGDRLNWETRGFLCMISSCKVANHSLFDRIDLKHPRHSARTAIDAILAKRRRHTDPWLANELYSRRLEAIRYFGSKGVLDLYGRGWNELSTRAVNQIRGEIDRCYRGSIAEKHVVLQQFKFNLCYENTILDGYITEKIFDAFRAGSVPIYLGAPDVTRHIPKSCFIDQRDFESLDSLHDYLRSMDGLDFENYLSAADEYQHSPGFRKFTETEFANRILSMIKKATRQQ